MCAAGEMQGKMPGMHAGPGLAPPCWAATSMPVPSTWQLGECQKPEEEA